MIAEPQAAPEVMSGNYFEQRRQEVGGFSSAGAPSGPARIEVLWPTSRVTGTSSC
jgi:hypothetical protein